jgi:phosphoribosylformylglycinamidine synthase
VIRIKGTSMALAITTDCNPRYCQLDPYLGAVAAVAEAVRNVSSVGAEPLAITDCLNFGSPERPEIMWQFARAVKGLGDACRAFATPVVSGNVSFYNETQSRAIAPTPTVGMVGLLQDVQRHATPWVREEGDRVILLGGTCDHLGASEYLAFIHGHERGRPPAVDLDREKAAALVVREAVQAGEVSSAHDLSEGGLAVALAECLFGPGGTLGMDLTLEAPAGRLDAVLFGEGGARYVITVPASGVSSLERRAAGAGVDLLDLGEVRSDRLRLRVAGENVLDHPVADLRAIWSGALPELMEGAGAGAGQR